MTHQFTAFGISFTGIYRGKNILQTFELPLEPPIWFDDFGVHCTKHETGTQRWYWYDLEVRHNEVVSVQTWHFK